MDSLVADYILGLLMQRHTDNQSDGFLEIWMNVLIDFHMRLQESTLFNG